MNNKCTRSILHCIEIVIAEECVFCCRIPWNGKQDVLIDRYNSLYVVFSLSSMIFIRLDMIQTRGWIGRFDGRALLDFIREPGSRRFHVQEKTEEEEELEEFVSFERYRDLIKLRRRGCRYFFIFYYQCVHLVCFLFLCFSKVSVPCYSLLWKLNICIFSTFCKGLGLIFTISIEQLTMKRVCNM